MNATREEQLALIDSLMAQYDVAQIEIERLAGSPIKEGSINDLRRGKRAMTADKWEAILRTKEELAGGDKRRPHQENAGSTANANGGLTPPSFITPLLPQGQMLPEGRKLVITIELQ